MKYVFSNYICYFVLPFLPIKLNFCHKIWIINKDPHFRDNLCGNFPLDTSPLSTKTTIVFNYPFNFYRLFHNVVAQQSIVWKQFFPETLAIFLHFPSPETRSICAPNSGHLFRSRGSRCSRFLAFRKLIVCAPCARLLHESDVCSLRFISPCICFLFYCNCLRFRVETNM